MMLPPVPPLHPPVDVSLFAIGLDLTGALVAAVASVWLLGHFALAVMSWKDDDAW